MKRFPALPLRARRIIYGSLALVFLLGVGYPGVLLFTGNLHAVVAKKCYRSGQLNPTQLAECSRNYEIKTILNLRGANVGTDWYDTEVSEASRLGITHVDFKMSARRELTVAEADALVNLMKRAQKPLLIHCKSGSDRTGLASALYLAAIERSSEAAAESQLSIRFGHFSLPFIPEYAMDRTFEKLEPSLGFQSSTSQN